MNWTGKHQQFKADFPNASPDTILKNCGPVPFGRTSEPHLIRDAKLPSDSNGPKRIRQSTKPVMNKLEQEWFNYLQGKTHQLRAQAITFKLCNGVRYTPDIVGWGECFGHRFTCFEVKGKRTLQDDSVVKIKVAAKEYMDFDWVLVWKDDDGQWKEQKVLA